MRGELTIGNRGFSHFLSFCWGRLMTITNSYNTLTGCTAVVIMKALGNSEMSEAIRLFRWLQRNFTRFLDWLLWTEQWCFVVSNKPGEIRPIKKQFAEGEPVSPNFLAFPHDNEIEVEFEDKEFKATPDNRFAQWFASPMVFYGHAIVTGNILNIVGKYSITRGLRIYYALGVLVFSLFNLTFWPGVIFGSPEANGLLEVALLGLYSGALVVLGMAVFLVIFKYIAVAKWRVVNRGGRVRLQNYLNNISEA